MPASELERGASRQLDLSPASVERVVAQLLQQPQADMPLRHHFAPGVCVRELTMPAGTLVIGHRHRFADLNIMLTGRLTLLEPDGRLVELVAPQTFVGAPGQKIAYVQETVIWQNVWPTELTDVTAIEDYFLDRSPAGERDAQQRLALERLRRTPDRESYAAWLAAHELPAEDVRRWSESKRDLVPLPSGSWKFRIGESAIEGFGVLATAPMAAGEVIGPARICSQRTPLGRYANHAADPNAQMVAGGPGDDVELQLVARRPIAGAHGGQPGEEITVNYDQVLSVNQSLAVALAKRKAKQ